MTRQEAESLGIDLSTIKACKRIRQLAKLDRLRIDEDTHQSGINKHLFSYIEYCGYEVLEFVRMYLSRLQPYMLERRTDQEEVDSYLCVIDTLYKVSVYIKADTTQFEEVIVSFHEDNKRGVARTNSLIKRSDIDTVPIFSDCITGHSPETERYTVREIFQRGLKELPIELSAVKCEDFFLVSRRAIELQFISYCNDYLRDLYTSDLDIDFSQVEIFSMLQQISFTSYGKDTFSSISLLIDSLTAQNDRISKATADFALTTFVHSLKLTTEQRTELSMLLREKFKVTAIKGIDLILDRVTDLLLGCEIKND